MTEQKTSWLEFKRRTEQTEFWACINAEGEWFNTAGYFEIAMYFCRLDHGDLDPEMDHLEWFSQCAPRLGYNVVSHIMLEKLYNAGLVS